MPIYEYRCGECGNQFEVFVRSVNNLRQVRCPKCGGQQTERSLSVFSTGGTLAGGNKTGTAVSTTSAGTCRPSG